MSDTAITLREALALDDAATDRLKDAVGESEAFAPVRSALEHAPVGNLWAELAGRLGEALDVPFTDVLTGAWSRSAELLKFRDPERYPPEKVCYVTLAEHTVESLHRPRVEIELSGAGVPVTLPLEFELEVSATVEGAGLTIQAGRIRKLGSGTVAFAGELRFAGVPIAGREHTFRLPGEIPLGEGIPLAPAIALGEGVPIAGAEPAPPPAVQPGA